MGRVIYLTMVADILHVGHLSIIKKAKAMGDILIVGLHPDNIVEKYKRKPINPFHHRKAILESIKEVDMVVVDCIDYESPTMVENLEEYGVDLSVHGIDWLPPMFKRLKKLGYPFEQIDSGTKISTTKIIDKIVRREDEQT